jgi:DNA-binding response OmpR family regulator
MNNKRILWVDDEIELLKPHILFLEQKGYDVYSANSGVEAIDILKDEDFDIIFLDEQMPGIDGLETLSRIKNISPSTPVVMITKSEEENIMEEAIGQQITDYIIKPVNPNQILLSLKKILNKKELVSEKTNLSYQQEFQKISMDIAMISSYEEWIDLYKKLVYWELKMDQLRDSQMYEILQGQLQEANRAFFRFISKNYEDWFNYPDEAPLLSHELLREKVFPKIDGPTLLIVIDNLRYDQWLVIAPLINDYYKINEEELYYSILPTATQYARNSIFGGLMPLDLKKNYPQWWKDDIDEGGKNLHEADFLEAHINRLRLNIKSNYIKILNHQFGQKIINQFSRFKNYDLNVVVYNFVDMLSHAKTEMDIIKELASNDKAYRSLTKSWFINSPLFEIIKQASENKMKLMITTDHGTINVKHPTKVIGDKEASLNLRYKTGRSLSYEKKDVYAVEKPEKIKLPSISIKSPFIFAKEDYFFVYPNNYNYYVEHFMNTYQHGGISLQEMIIPFVELSPR